MLITDNIFNDLLSHIDKRIGSFTSNFDDLEKGYIEFDYNLFFEVYFFAKVWINTTDEDDSIEITSMWIANHDNHYFGAFDQNVDNCYFTREQRQLITKKLQR